MLRSLSSHSHLLYPSCEQEPLPGIHRRLPPPADLPFRRADHFSTASPFPVVSLVRNLLLFRPQHQQLLSIPNACYICLHTLRQSVTPSRNHGQPRRFERPYSSPDFRGKYVEFLARFLPMPLRLQLSCWHILTGSLPANTCWTIGNRSSVDEPRSAGSVDGPEDETTVVEPDQGNGGCNWSKHVCLDLPLTMS